MVFLCCCTATPSCSYSMQDVVEPPSPAEPVSFHCTPSTSNLSLTQSRSTRHTSVATTTATTDDSALNETTFVNRNGSQDAKMASDTQLDLDGITVIQKDADQQQQSPRTKARSAALIGDRKSMRQILYDDHEHWVLNSRDDFGRTILMYAVMCDQTKYLRWLIKNGAQTWDLDNRNRSALHWAVIKDSRKCVKYLMSNEARASSMFGASTRNKSGGGTDHQVPSVCMQGDADQATPLHLAMRHSSSACLKAVLSGLRACDRQSASAPDRYGRTALHYAAATGNISQLRLLLQANERNKLNMSLDESDCSGKTPLMWAVINSNQHGTTCAELLLSTSPMCIQQRDRNGLSLVHLAVLADSVQMLMLLLAPKHQQDITNNNATTTANTEHVDDTDTHFRATPGLNPDVTDDDQRTPLHWAACLGRAQMANTLLDQGAKFKRDRKGAWPTHYAASAGHIEVLKVLLDRCKNQDRPDLCGRTAFMWAVSRDQQLTVDYMLTKSVVDRNARDRVGASALHLAAELGHLDICNLLLVNGWHVTATTIDGSTALMLAARRGHSRVVKSLLSHGADVNATDLYGRTAAHWCCLGGHAFICQQLTEQYGFDTKARDVGGRTAVHAAAFAGHLGCASTLIQAGFDVCVADHSGYTPLHMAAARGHAEVTELLLDNMCPVNILCHDHDLHQSLTPLDCALAANQDKVVPLLRCCDAMTYDELAHVAATIIQSTWRGYQCRQQLWLPQQQHTTTTTPTTPTTTTTATTHELDTPVTKSESNMINVSDTIIVVTPPPDSPNDSTTMKPIAVNGNVPIANQVDVLVEKF